MADQNAFLGKLAYQPGLKMTKNQCGKDHTKEDEKHEGAVPKSRKLAESGRRQYVYNIRSKVSSLTLHIFLTSSQNKI